MQQHAAARALLEVETTQEAGRPSSPSFVEGGCTVYGSESEPAETGGTGQSDPRTTEDPWSRSRSQRNQPDVARLRQLELVQLKCSN